MSQMDSPGKSRWFNPILAGATLRERLVACLGTFIAICLTGLICALAVGTDSSLPFIVAPIGASAVLLFAVPASPLAQPWPIVGGNTISALVGVTVVHLLPDPLPATGIAVALAIVAMSFTRSLHPPGGAAALTAVIGGSAVTKFGFFFPFVPIALNSIVLVLLGICIHRLSSRAYPHVAPPPAKSHGTRDQPAPLRVGLRAEDIDAALAKMGETYDIDRQDLEQLLQEMEGQILARSYGAIAAEEIMSRDVVAVDRTAGSDHARHLLLDHDIGTLPVLDDAGQLIGTVGLRELAAGSGAVAGLAAPAFTARRETSVFDLIPPLGSGRARAAIITERDGRVAGIVTRTDLLTALSRILIARGFHPSDASDPSSISARTM